MTKGIWDLLENTPLVLCQVSSSMIMFIVFEKPITALIFTEIIHHSSSQIPPPRSTFGWAVYTITKDCNLVSAGNNNTPDKITTQWTAADTIDLFSFLSPLTVICLLS